MRRLLLGLLAALASTTVRADAADELSSYEGYTIVAVATIVGYRNTDGKRGDSFEGCEHGRVIIFEGNRGLTCATYSYTYSYRPRAVILSNGTSFVMLVGSSSYSMRR